MKSNADRGPAVRRLARLLPVLLIALSVSGCAAVFSGYDTAPNGLPVQDDELRELLAATSYDSAFVRVLDDKAAPADELLRVMYRGIVAYYAGAYDSAVAELDRAEALAQDRITSSASALALSSLTNDRVLPYNPGSSERLLLHYYGVLAALRAGDREAAAVEARRLSFILDQLEDRSEDDDDYARIRLRALLHYLSAVAFEAYGAFQSADVSYRRAAALDPALAPPLPSSDSGDVIVVVERGFVDHLAEEDVFLLLSPREVETLSGGPVADRIALGALITARVMAELALRDHPRSWGDGRPGHYYGRRQVRIASTDTARYDEDPYLLRVAWPSFRGDGRAFGTVVRAGTDSFEQPAELRADVSSAVIADFSEQQAAMLARTVIRSVSRFALGEAAENKAEESSEGLGTLVGILANIGSAAVERADTRSWHLLPSEISVVRMRLPIGEHAVYAVVETSSGKPVRRVALGRVLVQPGMVTVVSGRLWR
ncbi:MAG TPA: hypothetical protein VMN78_06110 [Longimicrobiales bacterium]|nr:hypothetical protein [Longimicrobiales bacterium]